MTGKSDTQLKTELSRDLNLFHITMMGLGMMIGAGVFLGIGNSIHIAGPGGVLLTFTLNGALALFTAMSYAELSSAVPRAGGAYNFARIAYGGGTSFMAGWMEWFASSVAGSMYAITFSIYTMRYLWQLDLLNWIPLQYTDLSIKIMALLIALFFIYINYMGASETGKIGAIMTLGQTAFMVFIGLLGIVVAIRDPSRLENFKPFMPNGWSKLLVTMGFTYVAFEGYEVIAQTGDETIEPRKNLPKAMLYSVYIVSLTYVSVAFAAVVSVKAGSPGVIGAPWEWIGQFREKGFGEAIGRLIPAGNFLLTLAVIFASTSALNATIYSATRTSYALGRDGMLPHIFSRISRKRKTPWAALLFTSSIVLTIALFLPTIHVASSASIMFLFLFFIVNLSVIKIRYNMSEELVYGYLSPLFPLFPILAIVSQVILAIFLIHMSIIAWIVAPSWIIGGIIVYNIYSKSHAKPVESEIQVLEEERAPEGEEEIRVMIPIANPDNALSLVGNTLKLCRNKKARIKLLHMVQVPDQVPLTDAGKYMTEGKEGIIEAMLYLRPRFPITTTLRYCRNIARGIVSAVKEKKIDLLIMGWQGKREDSRFNLGGIVDPVVDRTPSNVVVFKNCGNRKFHKVLVPLFGDRNDLFAVEVAQALVEPGDINSRAIMTLLYLHGERKRPDPSQYIKSILSHISPEIEVRTKITRGKEKKRIILNASRYFDLVVLSTKERFKGRVGMMTIAEAVIRECEKPVALVKSSSRIISWTKKLI